MFKILNIPMKVEKGNGLILKFKYNPNSLKEVEESIRKIEFLLIKLRNSCEERLLEAFPIDLVERIIKEVEKLREIVDDIEVDEEYFKKVLESKNVFEYFQSRIKELRLSESAYQIRREAFDNFLSKLLEFYSFSEK